MRETKTATSYIAVALCIVFAMISFTLALLGFNEIYGYGFPDGGVTDYQRAASFPLRVLMGSHIVLGLCFLHFARPRFTRKARLVRFAIALVASFCVVGVAEIAVPWYFVNHLGLNDGRGG
jgi:hypothetical protein